MNAQEGRVPEDPADRPQTVRRPNAGPGLGVDAMNLYQIALFLHILGAVVLFATAGLEWVAQLRLRRATTVAAAREWTTVSSRLGPIFGVSTLVLLAAGLYMVMTNWGWGIGWVDISLLMTLVLAVVGSAFNGRRGRKIGQALATQDGPITDQLRRQIIDPALWTSVTVQAASVLGIIFLMVVKPGFPGSAAAIVIAIVLGVLISLPGRQQPATGEPELSREVSG